MPATSPSPSTPAYLESITKEAATCTLLTKDGGKVEVQAHLLSALSPFLACLLAQVGAIRSKREFSVNAKKFYKEIACWGGMASLPSSAILENLWMHFLQRFKSKKSLKFATILIYFNHGKNLGLIILERVKDHKKTDGRSPFYRGG